jgi:PAS domain S-box-containing protein
MTRGMGGAEPANILLVDDQPAKLLSYEAVLSDLGDNLIKATSAREALEHLLRNEVAVVLMDVCMPETDGFELAAMIREHPRFQKTAIIFVSAIHLTDLDRLRGYEAGAVDYVPVPVVPEVLRAKVRVFTELHRKTRQLERFNSELELRVADRTAELEASNHLLRESERRRSLAMSAGRMGAWDWDPATNHYEWDPGLYAIFGVDPKSFVPTEAAIYALIHPDDRAAMRAMRAGMSGDASSYAIEFRVVRPDGEVRWCRSAGGPTLDPSNQLRRLSGVTHDITERKRSEEALQRLNEELERRIEARTRERESALAQLFEAQKLDTIGHLTGGVAHDFNNLLMAVLGSLELLGKRLPEDERSHRLLENAVKAAQRGAALTQRLLAFARRQELRPEAVDLDQLVRGMDALLERALGAGVRLEQSIPADLPPIRVDANQLELSLLNLVVNARDAMPAGGVLTISASEQVVDADTRLPAGSYVRICVSDTGSGMDETTLAKASEPFFTTKGPGKGTGLGLSMVQGLAAQSGGGLRLSSELGRGTTAELWLPRAEQAAAALPSTAPEAPAELLSTAQIRVLVVDDDVLVSTGTVAMLEDLGHAVVEVHSGAQALERLAAGEEIDLVITDHAMPEMTGIELARRIRAAYPQMKIILATGYAELPQGADSEFPRLAKPFHQKELAAAIFGLNSAGTNTPGQARTPKLTVTL